MKAKDYRRQVEAELARDPQAPLSDSAAILVASASSEPAAAAALTGAPAPGLHDFIAQLRDRDAGPAVRLKALRSLLAASFLDNQFDPYRADFVAALRDAATDADAQLRRAAFDVLANMKDDFARAKLIEGLTGAGEALLAPAVALGLLARDDHGSVSTIARHFLEGDADRHIKEQAVRLLGRDPAARDLLARLMQDKEEFREVRRASAVALRSLNRDAFVDAARGILADRSDFADIRETVRGALDRAGLGGDDAPAGGPPNPLRRAIDWLRSKLGRSPSAS
jgi:hypothetical protein